MRGAKYRDLRVDANTYHEKVQENGSWVVQHEDKLGTGDGQRSNDEGDQVSLRAVV